MRPPFPYYGGKTDPPYLGSTRNGTNYTHELAGDADHAELSAGLHDCRAAVVLSGYHSPLYDELYADWHVTELAAWTTQGGAASRQRVEVLWSNRPLADASATMML